VLFNRTLHSHSSIWGYCIAWCAWSFPAFASSYFAYRRRMTRLSWPGWLLFLV